MLEVTDYELVQKCLQGDQDSFAELVSRYKKLIYSVVYKFINDREEVDDISQEVFIRIYKSLVGYNPQYKFSTWSVKIATNLCLDIIRKKKVNSVPMEEIERVSTEEDTPERKYLSKERALEIRQAIMELPEKYRTPILLYHQKGASYKEMSRMLNQPMSIIKNRLFRARLMLRNSVSNG
ncbi:MAG: sigma-70 family RNA polymerase sigma factor [Clostridiales bacterium]|jgi:RNA polymerase sigma-70 factor (ECF subfamily)|nr:sigma-70 family RNA polymerase sigma factor [Eubacteriales bacterium]MDH7566714.1 sigma-70 family RNA polymerase sigma factor [Clostridiales bacterium]